MTKYVCYDEDNDALKVLYQWDRRREIAVYDLDVWDDATVYFDFTNTDHITPITVVPTFEEYHGKERYKAHIPDEILQVAKPIILLVYQTTESNENLTIAELKITVLPRPKPGDSSYTPTEQVIKIPDGLELDGDMLYITSDGERLGDGVDIGSGGGGGDLPDVFLLAGTSKARYYYSILDGEIGIATSNSSEVTPVPDELPVIESWGQGCEMPNSYNYKTTVTAYPKESCIMLAVVMHRYKPSYPRSTYGVVMPSGWTLLCESPACGVGVTGSQRIEQYVSVYRKDISQASEVSVTAQYNNEGQSGGTTYYNRIALCLIALYGASSISAPVTSESVDSERGAPQDVFSSATGKSRLYFATSCLGDPDYFNQIWFANQTEYSVIPETDYIIDFTDIETYDGRLIIGFDNDKGTGKPWIVNRMQQGATTAQATDNIAVLSVDVNYS